MKVARSELKFPSAIIQGLKKYYEKKGLESSIPELVQELGVTENQLWSEGFNFDGNHALTLLRRMKNLQSEIPVKESLSFFSWSSTGVVGLAALSSATLEQAVEVGLGFGHLYMPAVNADFVMNEHESKIVMSLLTDFEEMNTMALELIVCGCVKICFEMSEDMSGCVVHFANPCSTGQKAQEASKAYEQFLGCPVIFNSDFSGISAPASFWKRPLKSPNQVTREMALNILKEHHLFKGTSQSFGERAMRTLRKAAEKEMYLSLNELSDILHMTPRTVMRKLSQEGLRFKDMLNQIRFEKAKFLLGNNDTPIAHIANQIGFKDSNAFIRAFKKYSGETPNSWRKKRFQAAS